VHRLGCSCNVPIPWEKPQSKWLVASCKRHRTMIVTRHHAITFITVAIIKKSRAAVAISSIAIIPRELCPARHYILHNLETPCSSCFCVWFESISPHRLAESSYPTILQRKSEQRQQSHRHTRSSILLAQTERDGRATARRCRTRCAASRSGRGAAAAAGASSRAGF
jgi:hypothetical protein